MRHGLRVLVLFLVLVLVGPGIGSAFSATLADQYDLIRKAINNSLKGPVPETKPIEDPVHQWLFLKAYCDSPKHPLIDCGNVPKAPPKSLMLDYDHKKAVWNPERELEKKRTEFDINHIPTIALAPDESLSIVIKDTNPLLYAVSEGEVKEENIAPLAELQKLANLLSGDLSAGLRIQAERPLTTQELTQHTQRLTATKAKIPGDDPASALVENIRKKLEELRSGIEKVKNLASCVTTQTYRATIFLQEVESGSSVPTYEIVSTNCKGPTPSLDKISKAYLDLSEKYQNTLEARAKCLPLFDAYQAVIAGDSKKPKQVLAAVEHFLAMPEQDSACENAACRDSPGSTCSLEPILPLAREAEATNDTKALDGALNKLRTERSIIIQSLVAYLQETDSSFAEVEKILKERETITATTTRLEIFNRRVQETMIAPAEPCAGGEHTVCVSSTFLAPFIFVSNGTRSVRWDKNQTRPIKIVKNSPYGGHIVAVRATDVTTQVKVKDYSNTFWSVSAGIVFTKLKDPTYAAATDPSNPSQSVIGVEDQESRAGKFALFGNVDVFCLILSDCPAAIAPLDLQLGAGIDTKISSVFVGLSYPLMKSARLGAGYTWQRVTALRDQSVGDPIKNKGDIKTHDAIDGAWYLSLSLSLGSLKFFTGD